MARAKTPEPFPVFTSDRMRLMAPLLTPLVLALALRRVTERGFFIVKRTTRDKKEIVLECEGTDVERKLALIVTLEINPREELNGEEDAVLYGESRKTIAAKRAQGVLD